MCEMLKYTVLLYFLLGLKLASGCIPRDYGNDGTVCVCNNKYCDTIDPVKAVKKPQYLVYTSNKAGLRFQKSNGTFTENINSKPKVTITIDSSKRHQTIFGWGGAFTDSVGININSLTGKARDYLLRSYFSKEGLEYTLCRVPIGGTDFSTRPYTYDDVKNDGNLTHFNLTFEDHAYKIPLMKEAFALRNGSLRFFASPWSPPKWMKTNHAISGVGFLLTKYYQAWANYYLKFLQAYQKEGIEMWGITTGNEPINGFIPFDKLNSLGWTPSTQSKWISENLGPTIRNSNFSHIKIMALDDQRFFLPWWISLLLSNKTTKNYVDGVAVHWYFDDLFPASLLDATHNQFPDKFLLATEACEGSRFYNVHVLIGSWARGEKYLKDTIRDVNHWVSGWVDWNMALNPSGGPNYIRNFVDSPILVNASAQEFYKQPMYYAMGHFSKFVPVSSVRISANVSSTTLMATAFLRPDNGTVIVILNTNKYYVQTVIKDVQKGSIPLHVTPHSFTTVLYW